MLGNDPRPWELHPQHAAAATCLTCRRGLIAVHTPGYPPQLVDYRPGLLTSRLSLERWGTMERHECTPDTRR